MIKFLYMTDPHIKRKSPNSRLDNYSYTIETKIMDFFAYGHEQNVDFFVCGGDFVDSPYTSAKYASHIGRLFKEGLRGKEMFFVWGNHDVIAWNPKTIEDTTFGLFQEFCDEMTLLEREPIVREYNGQKIELSGISSYANLDRDLVDEDGNVTLDRSRDYVIGETEFPRIHVVHGYLSPDAILDEIPHTVIKDIEHTDAAFTLTGHEHTGFAVRRTSKGNIIYNPGALGRVFASHTEMNRMPKYALGTIDDLGRADLQPIQSRVAKPGHEVMDRTMLDEKRKREQILIETRGGIKEVLSQINIESVDLNTIFTRFKGEVSPEVYDETKRRLEL